QNIPTTSYTEYVRTPRFCSEEWDEVLEDVEDEALGTWRTTLLMSWATIEREKAFREILDTTVDNGLHMAWALYWAGTRP
ncbi:unnamed protein product, partial [Discosporangium mesarthrocarpum]